MFDRYLSRNQLLQGALTITIPTKGFSLINGISAIPCMSVYCKVSFRMTFVIAVKIGRTQFRLFTTLRLGIRGRVKYLSDICPGSIEQLDIMAVKVINVNFLRLNIKISCRF